MLGRFCVLVCVVAPLFALAVAGVVVAVLAALAWLNVFAVILGASLKQRRPSKRPDSWQLSLFPLP